MMTEMEFQYISLDLTESHVSGLTEARYIQTLLYRQRLVRTKGSHEICHGFSSSHSLTPNSTLLHVHFLDLHKVSE